MVNYLLSSEKREEYIIITVDISILHFKNVKFYRLTKTHEEIDFQDLYHCQKSLSLFLPLSESHKKTILSKHFTFKNYIYFIFIILILSIKFFKFFIFY